MDKTIFIVDRSDIRNAHLKNMLEKDGYMVFDFEENISIIARYIYVFAPSTKINLQHSQKIKNNSIVFYVNIDENAKEDFLVRDITTYNIISDEIFAIKNAKLTAEGMLPILISNTDKSITNLNILMCGFGRLGKSVCTLLNKLNCNFSIATTTLEEEYLAQTFFSNAEHFDIKYVNENLEKFDTIINSIPKQIFKGEHISNLRDNTLIIDLASKPYGFDFNELELKNNIKAFTAPALPSKSPFDAGLVLKERIYKELKNIQ